MSQILFGSDISNLTKCYNNFILVSKQSHIKMEVIKSLILWQVDEDTEISSKNAKTREYGMKNRCS